MNIVEFLRNNIVRRYVIVAGMTVIGVAASSMVVWMYPPWHQAATTLFHSVARLAFKDESTDAIPVKKSVPIKKEDPQAVMAEQVKQLEQRLQLQEKDLAENKLVMAELHVQLKSAIAEVGQTNDLLEKRQNEWLATLKRVGAITATQNSIPSSSASAGTNPGTSAVAVSSGKININTATAAQLDSLPGIGATYAQRIIAYREQKGGFKTIDDLLNVSGIGEALLGKIKDLIDV